MTGQLRSTLQSRAEAIDTWDADLETIVRNGSRRLRRRRVAIAGGLLGVLVVAGGIAAAGRAHRNDAEPAGPDAKPLTYAVGTVIHSGSEQVDAGVQVTSLVQLTDGFVFTGPGREVYLWRDGAVHELGHVADTSTRLFASDDGLVAAWWDGTRIQTWPGYRYADSREKIVDDRTNSIAVARSWRTDAPPAVEALSDGHMWYWDGRVTRVVEQRPLTSTAGWKDTGLPAPDTVQSAAGDQILAKVGDGLVVTRANLLPPSTDPGWADWQPGTVLPGRQATLRGITSGVLSPEGQHWFSPDSGHPFTVYDSKSGQGEQIASPQGVANATPYEWLGDDTIAAVALQPRVDGTALTKVSLLVCHVSTSSCRVAAKDVGTVADTLVADGRSSLP